MQTRPGLPRALRGLAALLALYLLAPLVAALPALGSADWHVLGDNALWQAAFVSFAGATLATALIALGGVPLAYYLARRTGPLARALAFVVQAPLALPPLVSGVLLLFLIGPYAPLGARFADAGLQLTDAFAGVVLAQVFVAAPFAVIAARSAFAALDPGLDDVAATLGLGPGRRFVRVALPLAARGIAAGLLLAWLRAIGEFGATVMVAYHPYSLPVFTFVSFGSQGLDAMLPVLLPTLLATLAVVTLAAGMQRVTTREHGRQARRALARLAQVAPGGAAASKAQRQTPAAGLRLTLCHCYPGFTLDVSFESHARRIAIVGPSGSGKSLTLKFIAGLAHRGAANGRTASVSRAGTREVPNAMVLGGTALDHLPVESRGIAYVPQNYALFPHLSVAEQCLLASDAEPATVTRWADELGIHALLDRRPSALSLGQQQRAALVRALARPSRLILLDEPCSALDTPMRGQLRHALRQLQSRIEATTIIVSHDPQDALELADEIVVIDNGRVLQHGPTADVLRRPATLAVARLLDVRNVLEVACERDGRAVWRDDEDASGTGATLRLPPDACPAAHGAARALLRVPPDALRVLDAHASADRLASLTVAEPARVGEDRLAAVIDSVHPTADGQWLRCAAAGRTLECAYLGTTTLQPGMPVTLAVAVARLDCWPANASTRSTGGGAAVAAPTPEHATAL